VPYYSCLLCPVSDKFACNTDYIMLDVSQIRPQTHKRRLQPKMHPRLAHT